jgi:hypothetical protein
MNKKPQPKLDNRFLSYYNKFWWHVFSLSTRVFLFFIPVINLINLIDSNSDDVFIKIIFQLLKLTMGLFLMFNVFVLPGANKFYIPESSQTEDQSNTYLMYWAVGSAMYLSSLLEQSENYFLGIKSSEMTWGWHVIGVGLLILLLLSIYRRRRKQNLIAKMPENLAITGRALQKISENLTYQEQQELEDILLVKTELEQNAINNLGRLIWLSVLAALMLAVIQNLIGRAYLGVIK